MPFKLPELPYQFADLEPYIDAKTVEIHYSKHHQTYTNNLNTALENHNDYAIWPIEKLLTELEVLPEDLKNVVRNNGGGYINHNLYWSLMSKTPQKEPTGKLLEEINNKFGDTTQLKAKINQEGLSRFGSGWSWLVLNEKAELEVYSTPNQDSPLLKAHKPLLGVDVWEHAYYLKYQNKRNEYLENWWNVLDWKVVEKNYSGE